jgi:oxygen-independent coproporphyrinogen III oxidase
MMEADAYTLPEGDAILTDGSPLLGYVYSYPHKTSYRRLDPAVRLADAWREEPRGALFLYVHIPFCEMRCGFCNLFTVSRPEASLPIRYLDQLAIHAEQIAAALPDMRFARLAIGGGTPTALDNDQLRRLFGLLAGTLGAQPGEIPVSVEGSPTTVTPEKLALLRDLGVDRLSIGVQSFDDGEARGIGRPQHAADVDRALELAGAAGFPTINIDLIYGGPGQGVSNWLESVRRAIEHRPQEIYLYPLYVRPLTGMGVRGDSWPDVRMECYREARAMLLGCGYRQLSFRMFQALNAPRGDGPVYCCQDDGMIGLGCGARSYTSNLHYATPYAVRRSAVRAVLERYLDQPPDSFATIDHGIRLDANDQRRRYVLLSMLQADGMSRSEYSARFGGDVMDDLPQLADLERLGLMEPVPGRLKLTTTGLERSDAIGPWLFSARIRRLMETYSWTDA